MATPTTTTTTTTTTLPVSPGRSTHRNSALPAPPSPTSNPNHPSLTYHTSLLPRSIPTPALLDSALGGAHYSSGVESVNERRRSMRRHSQSPNDGVTPNSPGLRRQSVLPAIPNPLHLAVLDELKDVRWLVLLLNKSIGTLTLIVFLIIAVVDV